MSANSKQVGGDHYKTKYEHWDWALDVGMGVGYLAGCATKYVARARKKNGVQDLEKADHYVVKILEVARITEYGRGRSPFTTEFVRANGLNELEAEFCTILAELPSPNALRHARTIVARLIAIERAVPLEDSNKHADRA